MLMNYRPDSHSVSDSLGMSWNGIVGKVVAVYPTASLVQLITDPSFAAGVISQKNRAAAFGDSSNSATTCFFSSAIFYSFDLIIARVFSKAVLNSSAVISKEYTSIE